MTSGSSETSEASAPARAPDNGLEDRARDDRPRAWPSRAARWWRTRHQGTTPEERRRVIDAMFSTGGGIRTGRFWALQAFAIVIATMGLSANSAAVVIGAMLVAPLMTPIMAVATALALGWPRRALVPLAGVVGAALGSVVLAFVLTALVTTSTVTDEILARTSPDLRDLLVALAAGAAGALGTARQDVSASLPGVAVAVALVPPLATIGACLQLGQLDLASGAFLLFATNLVAIVAAGILVLLWCGFVPARLIQRGRAAVWGGTAATAVLLVAVGIPLTIRTVEAAETAENNRAVTEAVLGWLGGQPELDLTDLSIGATTVRVDVSGPEEPQEVSSLTRRIRSILGPEAQTTVRWSVRATAEADTDDDTDTDPQRPPEDADEPTDDLAIVRSVVDAWAAEEPGIDVAGLSVGDDTVVVDVVGERAPTSVGVLAAELRRATGRQIEAEVRYSERIVVEDDPVTERRSAIAAELARTLRGSEIAVDAVRFDTGDDTDDDQVATVVVDLSGPEPPEDPGSLVDAVLDTVGGLDGFVDEPEVVLRFTERRILDLEPAPLA